MHPGHFRQRLLRMAIVVALSSASAGAQRLALPPTADAGVNCTIFATPALARDDPSTAGDPAYRTLEDQSWSIAEPGIFANDRCVGTVSTHLLSNQVGGNFYATNGGFLSLTPAANFAGEARVDYHWASEWGISNDARVTVAVVPVNDEPSLFLGGGADCLGITINEDASPYTTSCYFGKHPGGGADESGQTFTSEGSSTNPSLLAAGPTLSVFTWTIAFAPAPNAHGQTTLSVWIRDSGGTANGGDDRSNTITIPLTILPVDDPPVANNDAYATPAGQPLLVAPVNGVLKNDSDVDGTLTASVSSLPAHGTVSLFPNGSFTYTPDAGFSGVDTFNYLANANGVSRQARVDVAVLAPGATAPPTRPPATPDPTQAPGATANASAAASPAATPTLSASDGPTASPDQPTLPPATGLPAASPASAEPVAGPGGGAAGADLMPWLLALLIVAVLIVGLNVGLWQFLRSRRAPGSAPPAPPAA